jgi:spermidine synthase
VVETRSGVITVGRDGTIYGGGAYDGAFTTDLLHDKNSIVRAYALSAFHAAPRRVLMIGLASGSWAQVIASHPQVESLKIIEINPGYLELLPKFPPVESLPRNPKVDIVIDDGRRWLARRPDERFDVIVQNTTLHYRDHVTNLLSREYLEMVAKHLSPGGVFFYNATGSRDAQLTGATVFPHAVRLLTFVLASESPIVLDRERWRRVLSDYRIDGRPVLDLSNEADRARLEQVLALIDPPRPVTEAEIQALWRSRMEAYRVGERPYFDVSQEADRRRIDDILAGREAPPLGILELARPVIVPPLETRESMLANGGRVITDDNMVTEWADGVRP